LRADRIIDVWDELGEPDGGTRRMRVRRSLALGLSHRALGRVRTSIGQSDTSARPSGAGFATAHKFSPLSDADLAPLVKGLRRATGRFGVVRIVRHGGRLIELCSSASV